MAVLSRCRLPLWGLATVGGLAVVATGSLPTATAADTLGRAAPVLAFLVAVTVLAELCDEAGLFDLAARQAAHLARGRTWLLFLLVVVIATLSTTLLNLDTTAVLLTPVVLSLCAQLGLHPLPFAMATVWLANTASLLLPVSNLTNLLAVDRLELGPAGFAARMWAPAAAAVAVTAAVLFAMHRSRLRGRYPPPPAPHPPDRILVLICGAAVAIFVGVLLGGLGAPAAAIAGAGVACLGFATRRRAGLRFALVPWRLVLLVSGLFLLVAAAQRRGLADALTFAAGAGTGWADLMQLAGITAIAANLINNLPAYLALEPVADGSEERLLAVLIGANAGPLVTPWASLATLLWLERCRARGLAIAPVGFAASGLILAPLVVAAATAALLLD